MPKIENRNQAKYVLDRHNFHFQKKYGQNFLFDVILLDEIATAANIKGDDYVIEIGPGMGSLTDRLAARAKAVLAIEIDGSLIPILEETLADYDNIKIINADVMKIDLKQTIQEWVDETSDKLNENTTGVSLVNTGILPTIKFVANLPYYITTPIVMRLLEELGSCQKNESIQENDKSATPNYDNMQNISYESITVMVQREVAERMMAKPGGKEYGALSLAVQYYTVPEIVRFVPADSFYPPPKVESAVICLKKYEKPPVDVGNEKLFFALIRASFNQRRKTLVNGLYNGSGLPFSKEEWHEILEECAFSPNIRGEALSLEDFAALTRVVLKRKVEV